MARQRLYYKLYPVSTRVDPRGVFYGLIQGATTEPESSLREILAYKKITAFDPAQVVRLVEDVIQGGMELTALDGRPRAISSMLKTYLGFDSSFPTEDARVTDQKLQSKVRLLKDLRVDVNMDDFTLINEREMQLPFAVYSVVDTLISQPSGPYVFAIPVSMIPNSPGFYVSYLNLTGRRLDEPASYRLKVTAPGSSDPQYFEVTETRGEGDAPYIPEDALVTLYKSYYSACMQVIWNTSVYTDPTPILTITTQTLQALNSEGAVLWEQELSRQVLP